VVSAGLAASAVTIAMRRLRHTATERLAPIAGVTGAFVFAAQMINFPIAAGTSGHLIGGALAAILLGRSLGLIVATVVVVSQALVFADGGLTAIGINVINLAVVPTLGGYTVFSLVRRVLPASKSGVVAATGLASGASVVLGAMAFSLEWLFGATAPVPFDTVFGAMVGVHLLIGVGEGIVSALVVSSVLAARPDLVAGARDLSRSQLRGPVRVPLRALVMSGVLIAVTLAGVASQFASSAPDGLERVVVDEGLAPTAAASASSLGSGLFAGYATRGVDNAGLSLAVAGVSGVVLIMLVGWGLLSATLGGRAAPSRRVLR